MITTRLTRNEARVAEFLREVLKVAAPPDMARTMWMAVLDDNKLAGFLSATLVTPLEARVQVFVDNARWKDKALVAGVRDGIEAFFVGPLVKLTMSFPAEWGESLSLAARLGFNREGLNKASFVGPDGRLIDQLYLGRSKRVQAEVGDHRAAPVADSVARGVAGDAEGASVPRHPDLPAGG